MGAIKSTPADRAFSKCVRERAGWRCERCGAQHEENSRGLHCSHYHGRGKWGVRFDPMNAAAHCYGCHSYLGAHPAKHSQWRLEHIGQVEYDLLAERSQDTWLGKTYRKTQGKGEVAKHYREQLEIMRQKRKDGVTGRIEFDGYT